MIRPFLRHHLQMLAAMVVGMLVLEPVRMVAADALGWSGFFARTEPLALAMATGMSLGMIAWIRYRGHRWRVMLEMCLAMFVPFLALFVPLWAGAMSGDVVVVVGHVLMLPAMALVMLRRPNEYGRRADHSAPRGSAVAANRLGARRR
jgi:hypothetical protein